MRNPDEHRQVQRNGVNISYTQRGHGDTTLLFIHGWCINKEYWEKQLKYFDDHYHVVAIDLPGFGESGKNRDVFTIEDYPEDIKTVIDSLELKNVILIGHSMSGDIIIQVAVKYPENIIGVIGIDNLADVGAVPLTPEQQKPLDSVIHAIESDFDNTATKYATEGLFQPTTDTAIVKRVLNDIRNSDSIVAIKTIESEIFFPPKEKQFLQQLDKKLFLVNSDVNPTDTNALAKYCKSGYKIYWVHGTGHYPMLEKPDEFNRQLEKAIRGRL